MKKNILGLWILLSSLFMVPYGYGAAKDTGDTKGDKVMKPDANGWILHTVAVVRILNKLEANTVTVKIPVSQSVRYRTLTIEVQNCIARPSDVPVDSAAFLHVTDTRLTDLNFSAWVFASEPAISVFEHPLYNISVVGCAGEVNEHFAASNKAPTIERKDNTGNPPADSLENSLEHSLQIQH